MTNHKVIFAKSGIETTWDGAEEFLLDLAEAKGIYPDSSCRAGFCHTCKVPLTKGNVVYDDPTVIEPEEGTVLLCCSQPTSDIEIEI